jgi:hypothetical protein
MVIQTFLLQDEFCLLQLPSVHRVEHHVPYPLLKFVYVMDQDLEARGPEI